MNWEEKNSPIFGKSLYVDNGAIQVVIPLEYGLRIGHFSFLGRENVFFEQPKEMTELATPEGWRVHCGHRLWLAPEGKYDYYPDNDPITYEMLCKEKDEGGLISEKAEGVRLSQKEDPLLGVKKQMLLFFGKEETKENHSLTVVHRVENCTKDPIRMALWPISAMAPGGVEHIPLKRYENGSAPRHKFTTWYYTDLGDVRAKYGREEIVLTHMPIEEKYKIGVGHPGGPVWYENKNVIFELSFPVDPLQEYPDGNVSYETYLCKHMVEMESLSPYLEIPSGESAEYTEVWTLRNSK